MGNYLCYPSAGSRTRKKGDWRSSVSSRAADLAAIIASGSGTPDRLEPAQRNAFFSAIMESVHYGTSNRVVCVPKDMNRMLVESSYEVRCIIRHKYA